MNCPIKEQTGDGEVVGRCWFHLPDGKTCPRLAALVRYVAQATADLQRLNESLAERVAAQSELLTRKAEKGPTV